MTDTLAERKMQFMFALRSKGVTDMGVLTAMEKVDRGLFVKGLFAERAYEDTQLPIPCGQTISQPSVVGLMTQVLNVTPRDKVLEVGTGSGYQAAILGKVFNQVYSVERIRALQFAAKRKLQQLDIYNVKMKHGDGWQGWPSNAPFDAIIVTAAPEVVPEALKQQLKDGGLMVVPVGKEQQHLITLVRRGDAFIETVHEAVRFVPLVAGSTI